MRGSCIDKRNVQEIVLVRSPGRTLKAQTIVQRCFNGREPYSFINPDEAVTIGAADQELVG
eukprot:12417581-Karenia_brevis.AAC.1